LASGVRTVVASVLPVDGARSAELMAAFHRGLAGGGSPARVLAGLAKCDGVLGFQVFGAG
ncbi:CHAT domain-containing protein, partial [Actinocorallia lasiicapitis]